MDKKYFAHETATVDEGAEIGEGSKIWHYTHIFPRTTIGEKCILGQNVMAGPDVSIGSGCKIQNNVSVYKGVTLEDYVFCGPSAVFTNVTTPRAFIEKKEEFRQTIVKKGAVIGANATIVCGNNIGKYALVAAGTVITKDVPDYALMMGVPGKQTGWVCKCGETLSKEVYSNEKKDLKCNNCHNKYSLLEDCLTPTKEK